MKEWRFIATKFGQYKPIYLGFDLPFVGTREQAQEELGYRMDDHESRTGDFILEARAEWVLRNRR